MFIYVGAHTKHESFQQTSFWLDNLKVLRGKRLLMAQIKVKILNFNREDHIL